MAIIGLLEFYQTSGIALNIKMFMFYHVFAADCY